MVDDFLKKCNYYDHRSEFNGNDGGLELLLTIVKRFNHSSDKVIIDVGANKGFFTAKLVSLWGHTLLRRTQVTQGNDFLDTLTKYERPIDLGGTLVEPIFHSIELSPPVFQFMQRILSKVEGYNINETVHLYNYAVSNKAEGDVSVYDGALQGKKGSEQGNMDRMGARIAVVPTITIDGFVEKYKIKNLFFVKIDTEGHDYRVLQGTDHLLTTHQIQMLSFEYFGAKWVKSNSTLYEAVNFLDARGYDTYFTGIRNLIQVNGQFWEPKFGNGACRSWYMLFAILKDHPLKLKIVNSFNTNFTFCS